MQQFARCTRHFHGLWRGSRAPLWVLGKNSVNVHPPFLPTAFHHASRPSPSHTLPLPLSRGSSSHHHGHRANWLDHTRETVPAAVPAAGPAGCSQSLTVDTDLLPVAGMAGFIQHTLENCHKPKAMFTQHQTPARPACTSSATKTRWDSGHATHKQGITLRVCTSVHRARHAAGA